MKKSSMSIVALMSLIATGCVSNEPRMGSSQYGERYSQDVHVKYFEEVRAPSGLGLRRLECDAR